MMTNTEMLMASMERAMFESIKVYKNGSVGKENNYVVVNHNSTTAYELLTEQGEIVGCTCGHSTYRNQVCKHQLKVSLKFGINIRQLDNKAV